MNRKVMLPDGTKTDAIGQGTWFLGEGNHSRAQEREALLAGIDAGMALIDTAERPKNWWARPSPVCPEKISFLSPKSIRITRGEIGFSTAVNRPFAG